MRLLALAIALAMLPARSADPTYSLWDGKETIAEYAKRTGLQPKKTIDLGGGVTMEFVLIPAGAFTMGTPRPTQVDKEYFLKEIEIGMWGLWISVAASMALLVAMVVRARLGGHRLQLSLAVLVVLAVFAGMGLLGSLHWWHSAKAFDEAKNAYEVALARRENASVWEEPAHEVTLTKPFYLGSSEVTQEQYRNVMGQSPDLRMQADLPVVCVSWVDAKTFCERAGEQGVQLRLPSEAEWEYACRAGAETIYCSGDGKRDLGKVGWFDGNGGSAPKPVRGKAANAWGVHDMHGNVGEWCEDRWHYGYEGAPSDGRAWVEPMAVRVSFREQVERGGAWLASSFGSCEDGRVVRGGAAHAEAAFARCAARCYIRGFDQCSSIGFRVVLDVAP